MTFQELGETTAAVIAALGGGGAIVFGLSGYLGKVWADRALEKQRQEYATLNIQLTSQLGVVTEERKHFLQLRATEHQVRVSKLHEKRAEVIADLYERFVIAYWAVDTYHRWVEFAGGPNYEDQAKSAMEKLQEAYKFFEAKRIYLSESLAFELNTFFERAKVLTVKAQYFEARAEKSEKLAQLHFNAREEGFKAFQTEFPPMRQRLDAEFRKLIEPPSLDGTK